MKLYNVWNGNLEVIDVLDEHHMCEGANVETYLCRDQNRNKFVCGKEMYQHSVIDAWRVYLEHLRNYSDSLAHEIEQRTKDYDDCKVKIAITVDTINKLSNT